MLRLAPSRRSLTSPAPRRFTSSSGSSTAPATARASTMCSLPDVQAPATGTGLLTELQYCSYGRRSSINSFPGTAFRPTYLPENHIDRWSTHNLKLRPKYAVCTTTAAVRQFTVAQPTPFLVQDYTLVQGSFGAKTTPTVHPISLSKSTKFERHPHAHARS